MGFRRFTITLENHSGVFSSGQTIVGCVHVTNNKPATIKGKGLHDKFQAKFQASAQNYYWLKTKVFKSSAQVWPKFISLTKIVEL